MQSIPTTIQGRASLALRMMAQAQYDSTLLDTKVFALLFETDGQRVLACVNERLKHDVALARVALSPEVSARLDASTLAAARQAQAEDTQPSLFPWLAAA